MTATVNRTRTVHRGRVFSLVTETVTLENGVTVDMDIIRHPGAAAIVALGDDGSVKLLHQYRHAVGGTYRQNETHLGLWRIAGHPVDPAEVTLPTLALVPGQDRIVPPASALALTGALPTCEVMTPALGHIGMVVAGGAREELWRPLADWLWKRSAP